jgi:hypothetical protein
MASTRKSTAQAWSDDLLLALRLRDVPGARIGEVLAEVQSHVAETGEDPRQAFGEADRYAERVAEALGVPASGGGPWRRLVGSLSRGDLVGSAVIGLASYLLADGLWSLGAGETALLGLPAWPAVLIALLVLGVAVAVIVTAAQRPGGRRRHRPPHRRGHGDLPALGGRAAGRRPAAVARRDGRGRRPHALSAALTTAFASCCTWARCSGPRKDSA